MSIEQEIAGLTQSTTDLLGAVNTKKATLDSAVSNAQTAVVDATSQVSLAAAEKVGAQSARDEAETHKDLAYTYSQSAASAVAYQDLTAIAESKVETAVDVFVYDTRKDSDGGAWRERTQGTSWYNETLNTATRGSRKEFPAVAVIVAEINKVTIYDGDDPSLPMWMVFNLAGFDGNPSSFNMLCSQSNVNVSVSSALAINGQVNIGVKRLDSANFGRLCTINFVSDTGASLYRNNQDRAEHKLPIAGRNTAGASFVDKGLSLVDADANDVAMTVLPNAPIDPDTGLPIPTIAVATDGGVSVIKDDGTVVDVTGFLNPPKFAVFDTKNFLYTAGNYSDRFRVGAIPASDISINSFGVQYTYNELSIKQGANWRKFNAVGKQSISAATENTLYALLNVDASLGTTEGVLSNVITSTYNTGWMNGDIKLATLSDTDDTDLVESGINDDFTGYVDQAAATAAGYSFLNSVTFNAASDAVVWGGVSEGQFQFDVAAGFTNGEAVIVEVVVSGATKGSLVFQNNFATVPLLNTGGNIGTVAGTYIFALTKVGGLRFASAGTFDGQIDNISVRLAEADRSVNGNGLQVFGTVQKNPVATGADLVAYSGWGRDHSTFLPINALKFNQESLLDFSSDYYLTLWLKPSGIYTAHLAQLSSLGVTQLALRHVTNGGNDLVVDVAGVSIPSSAALFSKWSKVDILYRASDKLVSAYVNGSLAGTGTSTGTINPVSDFSFIGIHYGAPVGAGGALSLLRASRTLPTAEQIAKIYRDEKVLFQEGAQATLHGTSDAVTALAYDDTTELLHVGTSSGRSVFQGLQRVDNTTDAVGTAISASNNLIVEE